MEARSCWATNPDPDWMLGDRSSRRSRRRERTPVSRNALRSALRSPFWSDAAPEQAQLASGGSLRSAIVSIARVATGSVEPWALLLQPVQREYGERSSAGCANRWRTNEWCADFAAWVWRQAGVSFTSATRGQISTRGRRASTRGGWRPATGIRSPAAISRSPATLPCTENWLRRRRWLGTSGSTSAARRAPDGGQRRLGLPRLRRRVRAEQRDETLDPAEGPWTATSRFPTK